MNWLRAVGFGVLLWVFMFVIVSIFIAFGIYQGGIGIVIAVIAGIISYILARYVKPKNQTLALQYGAAWVVVGLVLDYLITARFNAAIFQMWTLWLGYVLVLVAPVVKVAKK